MASARKSYIFSLVPSSDAETAFAFHKQIATNNSHIWPRDHDYIKQLAEDDCLYGVRRGESGEYVALCYAVLDETQHEWELGGLVVEPSVQKLGIAAVLARFALANTMVFEQPWSTGDEIIAYVHEANDDPRKLLGKLGFRHAGTIEVPSGVAPPGMKRNADGNLVGDKFIFTIEGLEQLSKWFDKEFDGTLDHGKATAQIRLNSLMSVEQLKESLRDLANRRRR
jgi:GNAT superfamily N-acetyltransferase